MSAFPSPPSGWLSPGAWWSQQRPRTQAAPATAQAPTRPWAPPGALGWGACPVGSRLARMRRPPPCSMQGAQGLLAPTSWSLFPHTETWGASVTVMVRHGTLRVAGARGSGLSRSPGVVGAPRPSLASSVFQSGSRAPRWTVPCSVMRVSQGTGQAVPAAGQGSQVCPGTGAQGSVPHPTQGC